MTISDKHLVMVSGDDYKLADQRAFLWTSGDWPNLAGATLTLVIGHTAQDIYGNLPQTWTYTMPGSPSPTTTAIFEVTSAQSGGLGRDDYDYTLTATLSDGDKVTLAIGQLTSEASPGQLSIIPS